MEKNIAIKVENLSKQYRLGEVGTGTLSHDLNRFFAKLRGKEDPYSIVGQTNDRTATAHSDYVWALKDINFKVEQGEVLGIIGKNGAGKSTLLKLISQITAPTTGTIKAKGRIASLLEVGTGMHPEMTARENIFLNGAILGMTKKEIKAKFDEIIDFAGCQLYVDTPLKRFSSGMRVRLGFAVAAFLEPEILIVDEVLAVGDAEFQKKAIGKMKDISSGGGRTVLFVSHNMASVKSLCSRVLILEQGKLSFDGNTDDSLGHYLNREKKNTEGIFTQTNSNNLNNVDLIFISATLLNKNNQQTTYFTNLEEINLQIKFKLNKEINNLKIKISIFNYNGIEVLTSYHNDINEMTFNINQMNKLVLTIPERLLNKGQYYVTISIGIHKIKWIYNFENCLSFNIDYINLNKNLLQANNKESLIAPLLNWKQINI